MMNFRTMGRTLTLPAPYNVSSGQGFQVGNIFAVYGGGQDTVTGVGGYAATSTLVEGMVQGVFDLTKDGSSTFNEGDLVYWDNVNKCCSSTVASNLLIGVATLNWPDGTALGGSSGDATVCVRLFGVPGFSGQVNGLKVAHFVYNVATDGGASCTPANADTIPANAVVAGGVIHAPTGLTAAGAATLAIGTTAGSSASSILTATDKASLSTNDEVIAPTCVASGTPFKMSAAGQICVTVTGGPLLAGLVEGWVHYYVASEA